MDQDFVQEVKNKKRFLKRYKKHNVRLARLEEKLITLNEQIKSVRTPKLSGMPRGGVPITIEDLIADKEMLEERISNMKSLRLSLKKDILKEIDTLEDVRYAEVLEMYFIDCLSFDDIAEELGYDTRHILRLYKQGIEQLVNSTK